MAAKKKQTHLPIVPQIHQHPHNLALLFRQAHLVRTFFRFKHKDTLTGVFTFLLPVNRSTEVLLMLSFLLIMKYKGFLFALIYCLTD
jgi:hypothetical protein